MRGQLLILQRDCCVAEREITSHLIDSKIVGTTGFPGPTQLIPNIQTLLFPIPRKFQFSADECAMRMYASPTSSINLSQLRLQPHIGWIGMRRGFWDCMAGFATQFRLLMC